MIQDKRSVARSAAIMLFFFGMMALTFAQVSNGPSTSTGTPGAGGATGASGASGATGTRGSSGASTVAGSILAGVIPPGNPNKLQVETVVINDFAAFPNSITRPAGSFYLFLTNATRLGPLNLQLVSEGLSANAVSSLSQTINLQGLSHLRRVAGVFSAPAGVYRIKSTTTGKVFLTITLQ